MITYSFGVLPDYDEFCDAFYRELEDDCIEVGNDPFYGNTSFDVDELWSAVNEQLKAWEAGNDAAGTWVGDVLFTLGIEWI